MKFSKIKSTHLQTAGKIILWIILVFIFTKGVFDIIQGNTISKQREALQQYMDTIAYEQTVTYGAMAFAEEFVREYLTYDGESDGSYENRVSAYANIPIDSPDNGTISVIAVNALDVDFVDKTHVNVTVSAEAQLGSQIKRMNLEIPIGTKDGLYIVDEYPRIIPKNPVADISPADSIPVGTEVDVDTKEEISSILESFFKVYYDGTEGELIYYLTEDSTISYGLNGVFDFKEIESLKAYFNSESGLYEIDTEILIEGNGITIPQHLTLSAKKDATRLYIVNITTR